MEELAELDGAGSFFTGKLVQQCKELNFNYRHEQPFSCHALLRAIIDHVPPAFGVKGFEQVASSVAGWGRRLPHGRPPRTRPPPMPAGRSASSLQGAPPPRTPMR
ncbi:hypothetical protein ACFXAF_13910 [Kitasatospora sp. NPDC059463]|uniref:hypothetical protein n=1 Tax=unclassified Kitasatospora TaxID=2633591 RepID=UPI0036BDADAA